MAVMDRQPYIEVKKARIARSGKQIYTANEVLLRGLKPKSVKDTYVEQRPSEILVKNLDKYNYVPLVSEPVTFHTAEDVTPKNWKDYAIGFVGGRAALEYCEDGNVYVTNDVIFYDEDAYNAFKNGRRELSAGYDVASVAVDNPDVVGYDLCVTDIPSVNHVALCNHARAGRNARILDVGNIIAQSFGGTVMGKGSILSFLGIGKSKDSSFALSKVVLDSITKIGTLDSAGIEKEIKDIVAVHIAPLGDGEAKDLLVGAVADSFKHPVEVLTQKDKVAKVIDKLYTRCLDADEQAAKAILDGMEGEKGAVEDSEEAKKKKAEEEAKKKKAEEEAGKKKDAGTPAKDTAALIEEAVAKGIATGLAGVTDSIKTLVDASVKSALGITGEGSPAAGSASDSAGGRSDFDASFLTHGIFGSR